MRTPTARIRAGRTPVSVQWRGRPEGGRARRAQVLAAGLHAALDEESAVDVRWDTLSPSAQTVEALVDSDEFDRVVADLRSRGLRVDEVVDRQAV